NTVKEGSILKLLNIGRHRNGSYICLATNACGSDWGKVDINVQYPTEATGPGENATVAEGAVKLFTCSVDGNPEPGIEWYSENNGRILSNGKQLEASKSGCYTCVASNNIGPPVNITHCLAIINASLTSVPPSIISPGGAVEAKVMIARDYSDFYRNLDSGPSKKFVAWFVQEMDKIYMNMPEYNWTLVTGLRPGSVIVHFILHFKTDVTREKGLKNLWVAISSNGTFGGIEAEYVSDESATSPTPASPKSAVSASPPWTIVGAVAGGVVLLAILVGVLIWDDEGGYSQVPGAYAQSGPPAANGTNGAAAEQQLEGATAIPNYAVVDKSKKKKKKLREEVPPVYAEVDKSKKKKKKIDDKNLYETLDEPKKAKIPGELLYADLGDFQNRAMSTVSISPQPLPAIKKPEAYERTDYADIAQFLKGNTTSPQNDSNEDTEWKPERPSKKKIRGKDDETQI
ncbi:Hemicentin-1, partial [Acropora cervicornis]